MNTDEVFKALLLETSPERAGRVGYLRRLNAEKAKKSAEFWNNDDAWNAAKKAQQKYDSHTATVDKHMKKFSRDRDSDWAKKLAAGYKGEETDVKNMRRNIKIGAGVGLGLAGAYGAYRLLRGKKKPVEKEKATTPTKTVAPKKHVIDTRQDPTEPASYPFKDSTDAVWANLMEGVIPWLFSKPDLVKNQDAKVHFITGLAGSGKTRHIMGLPDTHRRLSADHYFPENKDVDMRDTPFPRVVRGIVKKGEPATIEGVQAAFLHHKYPDQRWTVKRTSFLRSLANQTHRDWRNGGVMKAIKNLVKVPRRVQDNLVFKRQIDREFKEAEYLPGGRAEGKPSRAFPPKQLRMGRKVEMEHTRNPRVAEEIAKDHLAEFKDYYTRLAQMEREAKRSRR